jgi:hypothetical protein
VENDLKPPPGRSAAKEADENVRISRWRVEHMQIRFHKTTTDTFSLHVTSE